MSFKVPLTKVDEEVARHVALAETREALDDPGNLKRRLEQLPVAIKVNSDLRKKYPEDPERFMESEEMLDQLLVDLHALAAQPQLLDAGLMPTLLALFDHENSDIVGRVATLLRDTTELDEACIPDDYRAMLGWATAFCAAQGLDKLLIAVQMFEADQDGEFVEAALEILENLMELDESLLLTHVTAWIPWLGVKACKFSGEVSQFAAELLVAILQSDSRKLEANLNTFDAFLATIAPFVQRDPEESEMEWLENVIDLLCLLLLRPEAKQSFCECDGFALLCICLSKLNWLRCRAPKLLDYALSHASAEEAEAAVNSGILSYLGPILMERGLKQLAKRYTSFNAAEETNRLISILASLWKYSSLESRMQEKFYGEQEKRNVLIGLYDTLSARMDEDSQYALLQLDTILVHFVETKNAAKQRILSNLTEYDEKEQERLKSL